MIIPCMYYKHKTHEMQLLHVKVTMQITHAFWEGAESSPGVPSRDSQQV